MRHRASTARVTAWALLGLFAAALLWLVLGRVDVVASAPGKLVPADDVKLIQPGSGGIVHAILVRDGQRVRAGQPLVELDPTVSDAETAQAGKALESAKLTLRDVQLLNVGNADMPAAMEAKSVDAVLTSSP